MKPIRLFSPATIIKLISYWPPFFFSGISVHEHDLEKGFIKARLKTCFWNKNYFGTHFGGSLYSLTDPFFAFLLLHKLGKEYIVWDKAASIDYIKATPEVVYVDFYIDDEAVEKILQEVEVRGKSLPEFTCYIRTKEGKEIARVQRTLYVRKK